MKKLFLLFSLLALLFPSVSFAQAWSGIIDPTRAADWSNVGISGGVPNRTVICNTLSPGVNAATINTAIQGCPSGQVVFLNAGTYNLSAGITFNGKSNVTLRGAGPNSTSLVFTGTGTGCGGQGANICIIDSNPYYVGSAAVQPGGSNAHTWTSGYTQGNTSIVLDSVSGLSIGTFIVLDQANKTTDPGTVFVCDAANCHQSGETGSSNGRTIGGVNYNETQIVKITNIVSNTVTISPGLYMANWASAQTPKMWWTGAVTGDSIENLTIDNTGTGSSIQTGIYFYDTNNSWIKNVKSIKGNRSHVWLYQSSHNVIRDSYFYGTQAAAQQSYGVESFIASDNLIENNIFEQIASPIMSSGSSGNVYGYNYSINNLYNSPPSWMQNSYANHDAGNDYNLFEGNQFNAIDCDDIHGTGGLVTYFRNQLYGAQTGKTLNTHSMNLYATCRAYNVVGNVLGTVGYNTKYQSTVAVPDTCDLSIYDLGFSASSCNQSSAVPNDLLVATMLLRWGNYDTVTGTSRFLSAEVPSGASSYANAVPVNNNLPTSFYLSGKPSWWNTAPYPYVGPDVSGGTGPGGHAYLSAAQTCYNNTSVTSGIKNFDATSCYAVSVPTPTAPHPPVLLSAVVH